MVGIDDEAVDGGLEFYDRAKDGAFETTLCELSEEALDGVEPGAGSWSEVEDEARMAGQPSLDLWMLMSGVVVDNGMNDFAGGHLGFHGIEEADELLMAGALHAAANDLALEHVEGGKEGSGAVADVVMGHRSATALLDRQTGLGAVQRLDLAFLVERQHHSMGRWIDIEADDLAQLVGASLVVGQLELTHPMRLGPVGAPNALHRADADTDRFGHGRRGPIRRLPGRIGAGQRYNPIDHRPTQRRVVSGARLG